MRKAILLISLLLFLINTEDVYSSQQENKNDDVLLVVHYNHPYYESMEFIKNLYSSIYPNIVFYGEKKAQDVIEITTHIGFFFSRVVADALVRFPDYKGYLFLQDDVLMNYWNYSNLDKEKIWFSISLYTPQMDIPPSWDTNYNRKRASEEFYYAKADGSDSDDWYWWKKPSGLHPAMRAFRRLKPKDRLILERNIGSNRLAAMVCDMFYLPKKFSQDAIRLSKIFKNVFCEISIPTMLNCLDDISNWELLKALWGFGGGGDVYYPMDIHWAHALKFSRSIDRDFAERIIKENVTE